MTINYWTLSLVCFVVLGPFLGGLIDGIGRIISARLQGRVGPPLLQPFYDVAKLFSKEGTMVARLHYVYLGAYLFFTVFSGGIFFSGGDLLLFFFSITIANVFLVLSAYASATPFSHVGAERELIQVLAYEPLFILTFVGMYLATGSKDAQGSFQVAKIMEHPVPMLYYLPGCFVAMIPTLCMKLGKSPFDLSSSHHPHQEIVKGVSTDFSGVALAITEIAHWYKYVFLLGLVMLFFATNVWISLALEAAVFLLVILIDNVFARYTYQKALKVFWTMTMALGFGNIVVLYVLEKFTNLLGR
jgi:ech hydrogenase subunit B